MKLTSQNIQFIDNYLKNSEVIYYDIRMEMLDHVATAVEQKMEVENIDFYDAFKSYMMVNKKEILKGNKFWSIYSKDTILNFLKFLIHPLIILIGVSFYFFYENVSISNYFSEAFTIRHLFYVIILILAFFQFIYFHLILKKRFFVLEKLAGLLMIIYYLQMFFVNQYNDEKPSVFTLTLFSYIIIAYLLYFAKEVYKFNTNQKNLML
ncbi:hypothetical protein GFJ94_08075 [Flavobacterium sp. LMO8]|uniref:hypothetical protein n=1 Tax=Flavobacterium sp. LMO8 TaxID=2654244 RepID=UPI0012928FBF|nr:hypothetical protein [Flavobacterium sp. LMO8]MQP25019.1 hypothetical protein [Flavobacterium sp. LMO8]